jgi:two-component system sensor kinase FixL
VARVSELGQRIATMAHEVNQPLTAITNYVRAGEQFIKRGEPQRAQTALQKAAGESLRAAQIIQRLREYVKKHDASRRLEALPPLIEEATALALVGLERLEARLSLRLDPAADAAFVDKVQFQQVLLNLVRNADEAMAGCKRREIFIATAPAADGMVEVSVADTGPGIEAAVRERLFRPFVTTKQGGMGVGLNICRTIVEAHGGRIWVDANEDGGAVFRFTLPASEAVADAAIPPTR